jgi:CheY-like chemotaxis protein
MSTRRAVALEMGASGPRAREANALASSLSARGFAYERYSDPRLAFESLAQQPADVLLVDADSPWLDLREFVEALRRDPRTTRTLIVALASGDARELPARREIALVLSKPINADEAASRLDGLVVTRQRAASNTRELRGDLAQLPVPDLLQLLATSRASGTLAIEAPGRRGSLVLDNGDLRDVTFGPASGLKAFVRMLMLTEGPFVFTHGALGSQSGETLALGPSLFEATRQLDEIGRLRSSMPEAWVEVRRSAAAMPESMRTKLASKPVFAEVERLLESSRSLGALLDASVHTDADVLEVLETFRVAGLLDIAGTGTTDRVAVLDASFAPALVARIDESGRSMARVLVLFDGVSSSLEGSMLRALGGLEGFLSAEGASSGPVPLGSLGILRVGDARIELFAVPGDADLYPLCAVFGATADAAIVAASPGRPGSVDERRIAEEIGIPVAAMEGPISAHTVGSALRNALSQLNPRRN